MGNISSNGTNGTATYSDVFRYAGIAASPLSAIGLLANLFMLMVLSNRFHFSKTTYNLIRVSVISDSISCFTSAACYILMVVYRLDVNDGRIVCRTIIFTTMTSYGISMMTLAIIAIDRYFAVVRPFLSVYHSKKSRIILFSEIQVWIISAAVCVPLLFYVNVYPDDPIFCDFPEVTLNKSIYLFVFTLILYFIPSTAIIITYWRIIMHQRQSIRPGYISDERRYRDETKKKKFIGVLTSIASSYLLTTWPFFVAILSMAIKQVSGRNLVKNNLMLFLLLFYSMTVTLSITIMSPFLYIKFDKNIRAESIRIFKRCCCKSLSENNSVILISSAKHYHSDHLSPIVTIKDSKLN
ncbi:Substance-K receptor [Trichoplax sp. H2]|nr:Substance-K receptor [Trichoplax sp. H2]|eukprot:RDD42313.1 Substance-K receptor [Trichoplax sp. H2]